MASRGTLREKGFTNADTIAHFLTDKTFREQARAGYIYIDEAPLAVVGDPTLARGEVRIRGGALELTHAFEARLPELRTAILAALEAT